MANISLILESSLEIIPHSSRRFFFSLILIIAVVTVIGNLLAIKSILTRKQKCLEKVCIIALALADMFSVAMFATNNLDTLSRELKIWKLGEFLCHFIPMGQVLGTTASSMALLAIALDRYQNVTVAIVSQRWNPNVWKCIGVASVFLIACSVTSYPMYIYFTLNPIQVVYSNGVDLVFEDAFLCAAIEKDKLRLYYIIMAVLVFLPIITIFIWFYYQIAAMVWRHRKPITSKYNVDIPKLYIKKTRTAQVQRKIRTFKLIIALMVVFTACRLPYWIYFVVKLVDTIKGPTMWYFHFGFTSLNILNCALNPLLYTFMNQTIYAARKCHEVALYCCCFSGKDFEDVHRNKPFVVNCENKKESVGKRKGVSTPRIKFAESGQLPVFVSIVPFKEQLI